jgi:hypothetical protein
MFEKIQFFGVLKGIWEKVKISGQGEVVLGSWPKGEVWLKCKWQWDLIVHKKEILDDKFICIRVC